MLDQFLACPASDREVESDRGAFQLAWRPVGARPLSAALTAGTTIRPRVARPPLPSFELLQPT
jgi:hypothetical protein